MITQDQTVLSWIDGYEIEFDTTVSQQNPPITLINSVAEKSQYSEVIDNLISIGAISPCKPCHDQYVSRVFLVPKPNGKMRFILNLKNLNKFIKTKHFKLEDLRTVVKLVTKNSYMSTIDLKDAYFLIRIQPRSRKYLRFILMDKADINSKQMYEFNVLPFGLCTAPYIFTKLMKPVIKLLRSCGFLSSIYLDDIYLTESSYSNCLESANATRKLLQSLGFLINEEKSKLIPSMSCKYLGFIIDSHNWCISLPQEKRCLIKSRILEIMALKKCKIRKFAQLVGLLVSACPAIEYGWLYTKELERCKYLNLKGHDDYDRIMNIPNFLHDDLKWWLEKIDSSVHRIIDNNYAMEIYSDASTSGWGAACNGETASGQWSNSERKLHINRLELLAALFALKIFTKNISNCQILLRVDNTTTMSYINRMGGVQYPHLNNITRSIWQWCELRHIHVTAAYIKSSDNIIADRESRRTHPDVEWELTTNGFYKITKSFGFPQIDLFANRLNKKCHTYISWYRDPDALAIDAFTISWTEYFFYAFPPVAIILKSLQKIITDKARGIMVVPAWPSQPWYPLFRRLAVSDIVILNLTDFVVPASSSNLKHKLTLEAALLSARDSFEGTSHKPL